MNSLALKVSVKVIGTNGQISLGKQFAGRQVLMEEPEPGVWIIRTAVVIPDKELWLHQPKARADLAAALKWSADKAPAESDPSAVLERLTNVRGTKTRKRSPRSKQ